MTAALIARSTAQAVSLAMQGELLTRSTSTSAVESKRKIESSDTIIQNKSGWDLNEIGEIENYKGIIKSEKDSKNKSEKYFNDDDQELVSNGPVLEILKFAKHR